LSGTKNGEVILLHDGGSEDEWADRSATVSVLSSLIEAHQKKGFQFVSMEKMMEGRVL